MADTKLQDAAASVGRGRITARVPQHVEEVLQQAADLVGATLNQFVVQAALARAEEVIERERTIRLSGDTAEWFFNLLDNPPPPAPGLVEAFKRYHAGKVSDGGSDSAFEAGA